MSDPTDNYESLSEAMPCLGTPPMGLYHGDQARHLGLKVGDVIVGREEYPDGWNDVELTVLWIGDKVVVYSKRWRGHYFPNEHVWSKPEETASFTLGCREWYLKERGHGEAKGVSCSANLFSRFIELARREHYNCEEDTFYGCPKSKDGCSDDRQGDECNCGADEHNQEVDAIAMAIELATQIQTRK